MTIDSAIGHTQSVAHQQSCLECVLRAKLELETFKVKALQKEWYNAPRDVNRYPNMMSLLF